MALLVTLTKINAVQSKLYVTGHKISLLYTGMYVVKWKSEWKKNKWKKIPQWRCRGSNPGPFTCKANALPLRYIPAHVEELTARQELNGRWKPTWRPSWNRNETFHIRCQGLPHSVKKYKYVKPSESMMGMCGFKENDSPTGEWMLLTFQQIRWTTRAYYRHPLRGAQNQFWPLFWN